MPHPDEPYYCSQQIHIPPEFPDILKQFTKAAIRTQPKDVLAWSAAYFRAMANGDVPPIKERLEMAVATQKTDTGLTPGLLRVLNRQMGSKKMVSVGQIEQKWHDLSLPKERFDELLHIGNLTGDVEWIKFFALGCSSLAEDIIGAMKLVCEILTADPEGGAARIPFPLFTLIYKYLSLVDGDIPMEHVNTVLQYLEHHVQKQEGYVQPRNFLSPDCPSLAGPNRN
jgi:hypothetical protein